MARKGEISAVRFEFANRESTLVGVALGQRSGQS